MKVKIQIKHWITGVVLFEFEKENNTFKKTVEEAIRRGVSLRGANMSNADMRDADMRGANMRDANMSNANMRDADMRGADMRGANMRDANMRGANMRDANMRDADMRGANMRDADMRGADMRGIPLGKLPTTYINSCSRDMLFIFEHLKSELPFLREKLIKGEVDGTAYEGNCACLVGSLANAKDIGVDELCTAIPFYNKGTHNPAEAWFLNIRTGDTPENNQFAAHALKLIDMVLGKEKKTKKKK